MASITIKDMPEVVHRQLRDEAKRQGRSLNSYILRIVEREIDEIARRQRAQQNREAFRRFVNTLPPMGDSTPLIREDRDER